MNMKEQALHKYKNKKANRPGKNRQINQYTLTDEYIKTFPSIKSAGIELNLEPRC